MDIGMLFNNNDHSLFIATGGFRNDRPKVFFSDAYDDFYITPSIIPYLNNNKNNPLQGRGGYFRLNANDYLIFFEEDFETFKKILEKLLKYCR